jgi:hypothetical protein
MFREANDFPIKVQGRIASAICVLHNFIRTYDPRDLEEEEAEEEAPECNQTGNDVIRSVPSAEAAAANKRRDQIAKDMWTQYQGYLAERGAN